MYPSKSSAVRLPVDAVDAESLPVDGLEAVEAGEVDDAFGPVDPDDLTDEEEATETGVVTTAFVTTAFVTTACQQMKVVELVPIQ